MGTDEQAREQLNLDNIEVNIMSSMVCSNLNRLCILYLLKKCPNNEMQAEKIASNLGVSHRTALYHLDVLKDYELVEVREFRKKGTKLLRSVWGLNTDNVQNLNKIFSNIWKKIDRKELDSMIVFDSKPTSPRKK